MRGLAALMVAAGHAVVVYPVVGKSEKIGDACLYLFNGNAAVTLFFVLSGLVLGMGLQRAGAGSAREYLAYAVRRVFRISPVHLVSTAAILSFIFWAHAHFGAPFWFNHVLKYRMSVLYTESLPSNGVILSNLLLQSCSLNLVTWTLGAELICSLLLPLAHYARVRLPASGALLLIAASVFLVFIGKWLLLMGLVAVEGAFNWSMLSFFFLFYLGYLLPVAGPRLFSTLCRTRAAAAGVFIGSATIWLLASRLPDADAHRFVAGLAGCAMLGTLLYGHPLRSAAFLDVPIVRFYGRISYSFYLLHDLFLITGARAATHWILGDRMPASPFLADLILVPVSIAVVTPVAWAAYRWIELPFMEVGKRIADILCKRRSGSGEGSPLPVEPTSGALVGRSSC